MMQELHKLKRMLMGEIESLGAKGTLNSQDINKLDTLCHACKNLCKIMDSDDGEYSGRGYSRDYDMSGARGRYAHRDSMGRYSRGANGMSEKLRDMMDDAPDDIRHELKKLIDRMESM